MLQPVASPISMDMMQTYSKAVRIAGLESSPQSHTYCETLPRIICFLPPQVSVQRFLGAVVDVGQVVVDELHTLVEAALVESEQIRSMNLEPPQTTFTEWFRLAEQKQSTTQIIADMVKMRGDWIGTATEIQVMREVESVAQELLFCQKLFNKKARKLTARAISIL
jgi:hypothetical protein